MSAPSKTSRLGRGTYRRPSADVLDDLTDPGPSAATAPSGTSDVSGDAVTAVVRGVSGDADTADPPGASVVLVAEDVPGTSVDAGTADSAGTPAVSATEDVSGTSVNAGAGKVLGVPDTQGTYGVLGDPVATGGSGVSDTSDTSENEDGSESAGTGGVSGTPATTGNTGVTGTAGTSENSVVPGIADVSSKAGPRPRRAAAKQPAAEAEVGVSGNRGTSDTPGVKSATTPRDHVKVARPLVDEMRDAVWFLSEHGRPRVQLGELLDEAIGAWLKAVKADHNRGQSFPVKGRLR